MELTIEISMYPLREDYIPVIQAFIDDLNAEPALQVRTSETCTQASGDYDLLMQKLQSAIRLSFEQHGKAVFVCKFLLGNLLRDGNGAADDHG
jgi:uncharacterized protein YqgV (UPF0045/DUF77 family)